ncbi:MAG: DUF1501 domain-containing protein [Planctomyces sp.]|nr:DUF1501 domain-containing protein [Planctomyces sp.]
MIHQGQPHPGERHSRRRALALMGAGVLAFSATQLSPRLAMARGLERPKSLITVWLSGGPSQLETWDPHPGGKIGGPTQAIETSIPGARICEWYPQTAAILKDFCVVRSVVSKEGDHERGTYVVRTGFRPEPTVVHPSLGSIVYHELPRGNLEIPGHVSLGDGPFATKGGYLGEEATAFRVFDPGRNLQNLEAPVEAPRHARRLESLGKLSESFLEGRRHQIASSLHQKTIDAALKMMTSEQLKAFSLEEEPAALQAAYGDNSFGRGCLVARRLVETGVRAIDVTLNGFDTHANNFGLCKSQAGYLDPALASLVNDLKSRDLWNSTVVLVCGEFGRTPQINPLDGRDHWPNGFSLLLGGGGLASGRVLGATDPEGKKPPENPIEIPQIMATVLHVLGIDFHKEISTPIGRPIRLSTGSPATDLLATT